MSMHVEVADVHRGARRLALVVEAREEVEDRSPHERRDGGRVGGACEPLRISPVMPAADSGKPRVRPPARTSKPDRHDGSLDLGTCDRSRVSVLPDTAAAP